MAPPQKWTLDPPCPAEKYLQGLFQTNKIQLTDTPIKIQNEHQIFNNFSPNVFRNHFKRQRELNGISLSELNCNISFETYFNP